MPPRPADYEAHLTRELLAETRDLAGRFERLLDNLRREIGDEASLDALRRDVNNLRLLCTGTDQRFLMLTLHRLRNYLEHLGQPTTANLDDVAVFLDVLDAVLAGEVEAGGDEAEFVRSLPVLRPADLDDLHQLTVEILLVDGHKTRSRIVARELQACGYRVVTVARSYEALELAARTRPDLVIAAAVLDEIDGAELGRILRVPAATARIPFALLTSFEIGHPTLGNLPERAAVIRQGERFADDLAEALAGFGIA